MEKEAHDGLDELQMKTEEQTGSKVVLDPRKVEENQQLSLCQQVWQMSEPAEQRLYVFLSLA